VRILSKATNVITATAFVLLALWVIERNADRQHVARDLHQRRRADRDLRGIRSTSAARAIAPIAGTWSWRHRRGRRTRPVILVAIRNLPYDWIVTMKGEGLLPWLEQAATAAYFTRLEPFPTMSPKSLWASLATGKLPYRHGVTGRFSYRTPLNRERAVSAPAVWRRLPCVGI
jgi:hypothetical protein